MATQGLVLNQVKERLLCLSPTVQGKQEREACTADFEIIQLLGQGAFGKVYKVRHKRSKKIYALKQVQKKQIKMQKMVPQVLNEVRIMYNLDHPNIIKLYNHYEEEEFIYLILECATGGQLWHKLNKLGRFDERTVKQYMIDIMSAIEYLHTRNPPIIHRDIKPENILIDADGKVKLADFGWSNINNHQRKTYCGTLDYLAPEMIMEAGHDEKIDLWSLGVLIFELLTGKAPFAPNQNVKDPKEQQRQLEENILKVRLNFPPDFPTLAKSLITGLLNKDPSKRFTVQTMKEHPWLSDCQINQQIQSEQKVKPETIKDIVKDEKGQFSKEEIAQVINRQLNQDDKEEEVIITADEEPVVEQDLQKNTVLILNQKIQDLNKQLNEAKVLLQVKIDENKLLSSQEQGVSNVDQRKLRLLDEEKQKLKADYENLWDEVRNKDAEIMRLNGELQKMTDMQKQVEKLKSEKSKLQERVKQLNDELNSKEQIIVEIKTEQDTLNSFRGNKPSQSNQGSFLNQSLEDSSIIDLNSTFTEMKNRFQIAKEQIEEFDSAQRKLVQQQNKILELQIQLNSYKDLVKQEIQDQYDEQLEEQSRKSQEQIRELQIKIQQDQAYFENERNAYKEQLRDSEIGKMELEQLKKEIEQVNQIINDLKTQTELNKKIRSQFEQRIREQDITILDFKEKERAYKKK